MKLPVVDDRAKLIIALGLMLQWIGFFWESLRYQTAIDSFFFTQLGFQDNTAHLLDVGLCFLALISSFLYSVFKSNCKKSTCVLAIVGMISILWLSGEWLGHPIPFSFLGINLLFESSLRFLTPFALLVLAPDSSKALAILLSLTFFGHGVEALAGQGEFLDFLIDFMQTTFLFELQEHHATMLLSTIAAWDLSLAVFSLTFPRRFWFYLMLFWGVMTSLERILYWGMLQGAALSLQRSLHWIVPLVLIQYHKKIAKK